MSGAQAAALDRPRQGRGERQPRPRASGAGKPGPDDKGKQEGLEAAMEEEAEAAGGAVVADSRRPLDYGGRCLQGRFLIKTYWLVWGWWGAFFWVWGQGGNRFFELVGWRSLGAWVF